jgi:hypothetical protein
MRTKGGLEFGIVLPTSPLMSRLEISGGQHSSSCGGFGQRLGSHRRCCSGDQCSAAALISGASVVTSTLAASGDAVLPVQLLLHRANGGRGWQEEPGWL